VIAWWDFSFPSGRAAISLRQNLQQPEAEHRPTACWPGMCMQKQFHAALEQNTIHPVIDRTFNFDQVKEAYQYLQSGRHFGKIVIRLD
jgi:hypothetical protein